MRGRCYCKILRVGNIRFFNVQIFNHKNSKNHVKGRPVDDILYDIAVDILSL